MELGTFIFRLPNPLLQKSWIAGNDADEFIIPFLSNTKPGNFLSKEKVDVIKELLITTIEGMQADLGIHHFANYVKSGNLKQYYGIQVATLKDVLEF